MRKFTFEQKRFCQSNLKTLSLSWWSHGEDPNRASDNRSYCFTIYKCDECCTLIMYCVTYL